MLLWLLRLLEPSYGGTEWFSVIEARGYLTFRAAMAGVTSFVLALVLGKRAIAWLKRRFREPIKSDSAELDGLQAAKEQTPTMGGLFIVAAIVLAAAVWSDLTNRYVQAGLFAAVAFGALGALDDAIKVTTRRKGLSARQKLAVQTVLAGAIAVVVYEHQADVPQGTDLIVPLVRWSVPLGIVFIPLACLVLVGSSNAVNLTDGLDGLASGCMIFAGSALAVVAYLSGHAALADYLRIPFLPGGGELSVVLASMVGAVLGFLWFNCHPAQVFMGDTGSLPLGALLGLAAVVSRQEFVLLVVGGVFVVEAASVLVQVLFFKWKRRRVLLCAPLHHHFQFRGWPESKIVVRFWICAAVLSILAVASLKIG